MKRVDFLLTNDQYDDLKELLYECSENLFVDNSIAEFILKMLEENQEEYCGEEIIYNGHYV